MQKFHMWLFTLASMFGTWMHMLWHRNDIAIIRDHIKLVYLAPVIVLAIFGLYAATVVLYRVFTFNDCEEAAAELQKQIIEAKVDLTKKGFKFVKGAP